jgi:hypothetical protein
MRRGQDMDGIGRGCYGEGLYNQGSQRRNVPFTIVPSSLPWLWCKACGGGLRARGRDTGVLPLGDKALREYLQGHSHTCTQTHTCTHAHMHHTHTHTRTHAHWTIRCKTQSLPVHNIGTPRGADLGCALT